MCRSNNNEVEYIWIIEAEHIDVPIVQLVQHPDFDPNFSGFIGQPNFDFALLKMGKAIDFSQKNLMTIDNQFEMKY